MIDIDFADYYRPDHGRRRGPQRRFHNSKARYPLQEGGKGGGKSLALMWEAVYQCTIVPSSNNLLLRRTITATEKGGIQDLFLKHVPRKLYRGWNGSVHCATFGNGAKLFFGHVRTEQDLLQYQSSEFLFIGWDELTHFLYSMWNFMKGVNRCPVKFDTNGDPVRARMAGATNTNGIGHFWTKSLWIDKQLPLGEMAVDYNPEDYEAIHSTYADNATYANDADYISGLESITDPVLRASWISGSWDLPSGMFFSNWDCRWDIQAGRYIGRHVRRLDEVEFEDWQERWISIDWGFAHASAVLWFTRANVIDGFGKKKNVIVCYRELVVRGHNEALLAEKIGKATPENEKIAYVYLSPDRFNRQNEEHTIADRLGDELRQFDIPRPERANNERVGGWRLVYTLLDTDGFVVLDSCRDVIESVPKLQRDEKNLEDARKEGNELFLDVCVAKGTKVETARGEIPIESVRAGDYVLTRKGFRKVLWAGQTGIRPVIRQMDLEATANHPVLINGEFKQWDALTIGDTLLRAKRLSLRAAVTTGIQNLRTKLIASITAMASNFFTERFIERLAVQSLAGTASTIATETRSIIHPAIWQRYPQLSMAPNIGSRLFARDAGSLSSEPGSISSIVRSLASASRSARIVRKNFEPRATTDSVRMPASQRIAERLGLTMWQKIVSCVGRVSAAIGLKRYGIARVLAQGSRTDSFGPRALPVFNLEVEGAHEFFANGLLVHNCESLRYGLMSYASKAEVPREVEMDRRIKSIKDPTAKYMEYLRLQNQNRGSDLELNVPGPALPGRR